MDFSCTVENSLDGESLLRFLKSYLPTHSNKKIKYALEMGCVTINGIIERFGSKRVFKNDSIIFKGKENICSSQIGILFEDEYFLAINKPVNFESSQHNISKAFLGYYLVHRLDKNTTGVLLIAKTKEFKKRLEDCFRVRKIHKKYLALVDGILEKKHGTITSYLKRKKKYQGQTIWGSSNDRVGLFAETHFRTIENYSEFSVVELSPVSGRTHQLRVHLKELGHPILGDFQYCRNFKAIANISSLCLHALKVSFEHPITGKQITIEAPLPDSFLALINSK